jgi:DNA-binding CsgD family transcriptional regulator
VPKEVTAASFRPLGLSPRESEVLLWVTRGKTNDEVAMILGCGAETVKSHLKRVYQQLDVTNRAAAAARAMAFSAGGVAINFSE